MEINKRTKRFALITVLFLLIGTFYYIIFNKSKIEDHPEIVSENATDESKHKNNENQLEQNKIKPAEPEIKEKLKQDIISEIQWANIPAGSFLMGSPLNEKGRKGDEKQFRCTLSAFKMSKYEITVTQFYKFCEATGRNKPTLNNENAERIPISNICWKDANDFAQWIGAELPTEAQWEYACRSGNKTPFNTGNKLSSEQANYNGYYPYEGDVEGKYIAKLTEVGSYPANSYGLSDMHGNVWEWCRDYHALYPESAQKNPKGPKNGNTRIIRGGSYLSSANDCRSARRLSFAESYIGESVGFRVVR